MCNISQASNNTKKYSLMVSQPSNRRDHPANNLQKLATLKNFLSNTVAQFEQEKLLIEIQHQKLKPKSEKEKVLIQKFKDVEESNNNPIIKLIIHTIYAVKHMRLSNPTSLSYVEDPGSYSFKLENLSMQKATIASLLELCSTLLEHITNLNISYDEKKCNKFFEELASFKEFLNIALHMSTFDYKNDVLSSSIFNEAVQTHLNCYSFFKTESQRQTMRTLLAKATNSNSINRSGIGQFITIKLQQIKKSLPDDLEHTIEFKHILTIQIFDSMISKQALENTLQAAKKYLDYQPEYIENTFQAFYIAKNYKTNFDYIDLGKAILLNKFCDNLVADKEIFDTTDESLKIVLKSGVGFETGFFPKAYEHYMSLDLNVKLKVTINFNFLLNYLGIKSVDFSQEHIKLKKEYPTFSIPTKLRKFIHDADSFAICMFVIYKTATLTNNQKDGLRLHRADKISSNIKVSAINHEEFQKSNIDNSRQKQFLQSSLVTLSSAKPIEDQIESLKHFIKSLLGFKIDMKCVNFLNSIGEIELATKCGIEINKNKTDLKNAKALRIELFTLLHRSQNLSYHQTLINILTTPIKQNKMNESIDKKQVMSNMKAFRNITIQFKTV